MQSQYPKISKEHCVASVTWRLHQYANQEGLDRNHDIFLEHETAQNAHEY